MTSTIKWVVLGIMFAVISIVLYIGIDSWAAESNMGIVVTIGFFLAATACIMCIFKIFDSGTHFMG